jgi:hypothetical protein
MPLARAAARCRAAARGRSCPPSGLPASRPKEHSAGEKAGRQSRRSAAGFSRSDPRGSARRAEGARSASAGEKPDGAAVARPPRQLETTPACSSWCSRVR